MKKTEDKIKISDINEDWKGKWEIKNNNEFYILLDNKKILKYFITSLNNENIELQSFGIVIPTLGYKRKSKK